MQISEYLRCLLGAGIKKTILICLLLVVTVPHAYSQCERTFYGKPGGVYLFGDRNNYTIYGKSKFVRDSFDVDSTRYLFFGKESDTSGGLIYIVTKDQRVFSSNRSIEHYRLCDTVGSMWKWNRNGDSTTDRVMYDGLRPVDVMGGVQLAHRFLRIALWQGEWEAIEEEFVMDSFGLVLIKDIWHGSERYRRIGAYLGGVYYGDPRPVSVIEQEQETDTMLSVHDGILRLDGFCKENSDITLYDLRGIVVYSGQASAECSVNLISLATGVYSVTVVDTTGKPYSRLIYVK